MIIKIGIIKSYATNITDINYVSYYTDKYQLIYICYKMMLKCKSDL